MMQEPLLPVFRYLPGYSLPQVQFLVLNRWCRLYGYPNPLECHPAECPAWVAFMIPSSWAQWFHATIDPIIATLPQLLPLTTPTHEPVYVAPCTGEVTDWLPVPLQTELDIMLPWSPGMNLATAEILLTQVAVFKFTPYRLEISKDETACVLKLQQAHAKILSHTLEVVIQSFKHYSVTQREQAYVVCASSCVLQQKQTSVSCLPLSVSFCELYKPEVLQRLVTLSNDPLWNVPQVTILDITWLPTLHHPFWVPRWWRTPLHWSSPLCELTYGLCWHLALFIKAMATAWDLISQTDLWMGVLRTQTN